MPKEHPYSFDAYLKIRDAFNDYLDNPFVQQALQHYAHEEWPDLHAKLKTFSEKTSFRWRKMADDIAHPNHHPALQHYDAYNHRIDQIVRTETSLQLQKEAFAERLFSKDTSDWERTAKRFLMHHNGEAGIMCPIACTDGLVALLETYEHTLNEPLQHILQHCTEGIDGDFGVGAQFMSEIQSGSNIPANILQAIPTDDGHDVLYGNKFFCSAAHADYTVVIARVKDTGHIGLFVVPSWLPGDKTKFKRNGAVINRLKRKLGTCELPTAEIDYDGAIAYPVGPIERGVANAVGIVLTRSRLDIGLASAAFMMRTAREALLYSRFREVFGRRIYQFPLANSQLNVLEETAKRTTAGAFKLFSQWFELQREQYSPSRDEEAWKLRKFQLRELILLQKITAAKETVDMIRLGISIFGGHGVMEDFSSLPRLLRDAMVNELWEGPKNVLLAQIYRDFQRAAAWYSPREFVADLLPNHPYEEKEALFRQLEACLAADSLTGEPTGENMQFARNWETVCEQLFIAYQNEALMEMPKAPLVKQETLQALEQTPSLQHLFEGVSR